MKKLTILFAFIILTTCLHAQRPDPVHFTYTIQKVNDKTYELHVLATINPGWHVYSQDQSADAVAEPTKIVFDKNPLIIITGKPKEVGKKEKYEDKQAGIVQYQYAEKLEFVQTLTLKSQVKTNVSGSLTYQTCTDEMCLPPKTVKFNVPL